MSNYFIAIEKGALKLNMEQLSPLNVCRKLTLRVTLVTDIRKIFKEKMYFFELSEPH